MSGDGCPENPEFSHMKQTGRRRRECRGDKEGREVVTQPKETRTIRKRVPMHNFSLGWMKFSLTIQL